MKRHYFVLTLAVIGLALIFQTGCQQQAKETTEPSATITDPNKPSPEITLDKDVLDFGEIGFEVKNIGELKFTNTGEAPLKITKVRQCCGVVAKLDKMEYAPGESGTLKVEWKSKRQPSLFMRQLYILSNDPTNPEVKLTIKAQIVAKVTWEPDRIKLCLDEENANCPKLTIKSLDGQQFSITDIKSTGDCITGEFDPNAEATEFDIELKVDTEKLVNNLKGRIYISMTHPEGKMATILFDVLPKFTVTPPLIIVFNAESQKPIVRKISILNNYKKEFEIESSSSKDDTMKILNQKKITNGYQLEVEIMPPVPDEGKIKFSDVLSINIKDGEKLAVTCNGYYSKTRSTVKGI
jgi:hypothetical protein